MNALGALETFLHAGLASVPLLARCGLAHAQSETIHPFLHGNGRVGRLLITFMLCEEKALTRPLLYLRVPPGVGGKHVQNAARLRGLTRRLRFESRRSMPTLDWLNRQDAFAASARVPYRLLEPVPEHGAAAAREGHYLKVLMGKVVGEVFELRVGMRPW